MSAGLRCDGPACGTFSPCSAGWLYLIAQPEHPSMLSALGIERQADPLTFCSMRCVAGYAYVETVTTSEATGVELPPRSGIGWPR